MSAELLTTGEVAPKLKVPVWLVRAVCDSINADLPRAGLYRLVPAGLIPKIKAEIDAREKREKRGAA